MMLDRKGRRGTSGSGAQYRSGVKSVKSSGVPCSNTSQQGHEEVQHEYIQKQVSRVYLEQLDSNNSKHELQQTGDQHDVADGLNGHYDALNYMLK
ncbi:hypothetical protein E2C01_000679 [Portunus trituberculatus]|uniref:Uncharacterized protein n=1 Tax=Portunus trituberculatus TaxID=210409 RepID=A0A5B7CH77_PORTR|nr:hypothetical protein [Portunus trituberculatus]